MSNWSPTYKAVCDICGETNEVSNYGDWACRQCLQGYTYEECHQISLTDAQLALLRNPPKWISVDERLPEIGVSVLCSSKEPPGDDWVWIGQREEYEWYFPGANEMGTPTHWMSLPEPPEVK